MNNQTQGGFDLKDAGQSRIPCITNNAETMQQIRGQRISSKTSINSAMHHLLDELHIGQMIYKELKAQGRSVSWLAQQLNMERASLYYTFKQNTINLELLMRISATLNYNFLKDVNEIYERFIPQQPQYDSSN